MSATLEIKVDDGQSFQLAEGVNRIGRGPDNVIRITDPSVSGHHCEIISGPDGTMIRDLGSTNGIFVGDQRVEAGPLEWDKPFWIGSVECVLRPGDSRTGLGTCRRRINRIDEQGWKALALGLGLALGVCFVPLLAYIIDFLRLIIHETGHTLTAWFFGYPTIPMLRPGGAVSAALGVQPPLMVLAMLTVLGKLLYTAYRTRRHTVAITIGAAVYLLTAFSSLGRFVITLMGHGAELAVASLFLYRALSGKSILVRAERPLYAAVALVIFGLDIRFATALLIGSEAEADYREGLEGTSHDLIKVGEEYLKIGLQPVALVFLALCLLAPCFVFLYHRFCAGIGSSFSRRPKAS